MVTSLGRKNMTLTLKYKSLVIFSIPTCPEQGFIEKKNSSVQNHVILSNIGLGGSENANKKIFHWENF